MKLKSHGSMPTPGAVKTKAIRKAAELLPTEHQPFPEHNPRLWVGENQPIEATSLHGEQREEWACVG